MEFAGQLWYNEETATDYFHNATDAALREFALSCKHRPKPHAGSTYNPLHAAIEEILLLREATRDLKTSHAHTVNRANQVFFFGVGIGAGAAVAIGLLLLIIYSFRNAIGA